MFEFVPPVFYFLGAALLLPFIPQGVLRGLFSLAVPIGAGWAIWTATQGVSAQTDFMGYTLTLMRVDGLSTFFGLAFSLAAFVCLIYAWHIRDTVQQVSTLLYAGAAVGAVFAGDLITLFVFWEGTAIASVFLIWARRTQGAYFTGLRYLIVQIGSGVILLAGIVLHVNSTGSIAFDSMILGSAASWTILLAFGIKAAFPFLHNWLEDSYPAATITGTVILSAFTTKLAIYALARGFAGTEELLFIGAAMAVVPSLYAVFENDLRRTLAYALNAQLGFMVVGIGIGTELAVNGAAAHAFASIFYKGLLFMGVGAVLYRTGTAKVTELGGLAKSMPWTMAFTLVGAASIAALPLFSGFTTKSLILSAAGNAHMLWVWGALLFASACAAYHSGIKIIYFTFFGEDRGLTPKEAPLNMKLAMGITAIICLAVGILPEQFYALLPYDVDYHAYSFSHVITQLQLVVFVLLAFLLVKNTRFFPAPRATVSLDTDWLYRKVIPYFLGHIATIVERIWTRWKHDANLVVSNAIQASYRTHGPQGPVARTWPTGSMVLWVAALLGITLLLTYI
ncbi:MAG: Na(+)/H(+) antiporter subunit D [Parvibaculaceae bacterium]|nr:Na(+)/H(+) antiporter subunit D [Parvibaculaceae bacterium]